MKAYTTLALRVYERTPYTNAAYVFAKGGNYKKDTRWAEVFFLSAMQYLVTHSLKCLLGLFKCSALCCCMLF